MEDEVNSSAISNLRRVLISNYARKGFISYYFFPLRFAILDPTMLKEWGYLKGPKKLLEPDIIESTERPVLNLIKELHLRGCCIDVGCWIGYYSLLLAREAKTVIALEPDPRNIRYFEHNINLNKVKNIQILPFALDTKDGNASLVLAPMSTGNSLHATGYTRGVKTIKLETLLKSIPEEEIDLIKMDIEGAEFAVIKSLDGNVFRRVSRWIIECHRKGTPQDEVQSILESNGYQIKWLKNNNNGLTDHIYASKK